MGPTIPYFGKRAPISKSAPRIFFAFVNVFEGFEVDVISSYWKAYLNLFSPPYDSRARSPSWALWRPTSLIVMRYGAVSHKS